MLFEVFFAFSGMCLNAIENIDFLMQNVIPGCKKRKLSDLRSGISLLSCTAIILIVAANYRAVIEAWQLFNI